MTLQVPGAWQDVYENTDQRNVWRCKLCGERLSVQSDDELDNGQLSDYFQHWIRHVRALRLAHKLEHGNG